MARGRIGAGSFLGVGTLERFASLVVERSKIGRESDEALNWITQEWQGPSKQMLQEWLHTQSSTKQWPQPYLRQ